MEFYEGFVLFKKGVKEVKELKKLRHMLVAIKPTTVLS